MHRRSTSTKISRSTRLPQRAPDFRGRSGRTECVRPAGGRDRQPLAVLGRSSADTRSRCRPRASQARVRSVRIIASPMRAAVPRPLLWPIPAHASRWNRIGAPKLSTIVPRHRAISALLPPQHSRLVRAARDGDPLWPLPSRPTLEPTACMSARGRLAGASVFLLGVTRFNRPMASMSAALSSGLGR
jgi:hypothetical protein